MARNRKERLKERARQGRPAAQVRRGGVRRELHRRVARRVDRGVRRAERRRVRQVGRDRPAGPRRVVCYFHFLHSGYD